MWYIQMQPLIHCVIKQISHSDSPNGHRTHNPYQKKKKKKGKTKKKKKKTLHSSSSETNAQ